MASTEKGHFPTRAAVEVAAEAAESFPVVYDDLSLDIAHAQLRAVIETDIEAAKMLPLVAFVDLTTAAMRSLRALDGLANVGTALDDDPREDLRSALANLGIAVPA